MRRIRDEIFKILETERAAAALKAMDKAGLLDKGIPQVKVMYHCAQKGTLSSSGCLAAFSGSSGTI